MSTVFIIILSYLLGSIPFALLVGKFFYKTDIREFGSGNLGSTNTFRTLGKKAGITVMIADIGKGTLAACLPILFHNELHPLLVGVFAIIGHSYPLFANFKGGKSVATTAGILIAVSPLAFVIGALSFLLTLTYSKYVSLSSSVAGLFIFISSIFIGDPILQVFTLFITVFIAYKHRSNFSRIKLGTEPKVKWF